jgi:hypothetical protein
LCLVDRGCVGEHRPGVGFDLVDGRVIVVGVVAGEDQLADSCHLGRLHRMLPSRVTPTHSVIDVVLGGVLGIVDEDIRPLCEGDKPSVDFVDAGLVVGGDHHRPVRPVDTVSNDGIRVVQIYGAYEHRADLNFCRHHVAAHFSR